ncbi:unnamed protein product [Prorocentrum cordatum]|uniref:Uncharacterized protein n=1 Tax=Prorocentrum cordatum TaxID=2364126 RepID=A0ABN9R9X4_9DINO|nr:unnamed protein product [Polarella glacialis]
MLTSTVASDERLSMGLQQRPIWTPLEEPFCWRPLSNRLGLHAFALDLFLWRTNMTAIGDNSSKKGGLRPAKRGFAERGSGYEGSAANLQGFSTADASLHCGFVGYVVSEFEKICGSGSDFCSPRVLLPSSLLVPFQGYLESDGLRSGITWDICEYSGDNPRSDMLVTVRHSVVIVVREEDWSSPERAWQLHADAIGDEDVAGPAAAPVVVLTCMQHGVEVGQTVINKLLQTWAWITEKDAVRGEDITPWSFFAPVAGAMQSLQNNEKAAEKLAAEVRPLLRDSRSCIRESILV